MTRSCALVILAAGIGSRFGGIKQLEPVGPAGEIFLDYSVHDAVAAGFDHIVFIIRREIEADFHAVIGRRLEAWCAERNVSVAYAIQDPQDLPGGYACPEDRRKPWGTVHALLSCRNLDMPFVAINADDYYGKQVFRDLLAWLQKLPDGSEGMYCMAGFRMDQTLSDNGGVSRGICRTDENGCLVEVKETKQIVRTADGAVGLYEGTEVLVPPDSLVSMNIWGFTPDIFSKMEQCFLHFLRLHGEDGNREYVLSTMIDDLLSDGSISVRVLPAYDRWFGVTFREDLPPVREAFLQMVQQGIYQSNLFGK